jgi:microcystin-dependent protein
MSEPFLGEIRMFSFSFPPRGWALCNGQILSIQQNAALFAILGTTYGGNGQTTFALPNLQGNAPAHVGNSITLGQVGGSAGVTLTTSQIGHGHAVSASATATSDTAGGNFPATSATSIYGSKADTTMNAAVISPSGGGVAHNNMQPYLVVNFAIALTGIFPSRN